MTDTTQSDLSLSDLAIIPIGPSPPDIWSIKGIIALIRQTTANRDLFKVKLLICKTIVGTRLIKEARETLNEFCLELFETQISQRVAFI